MSEHDELALAVRVLRVAFHDPPGDVLIPPSALPGVAAELGGIAAGLAELVAEFRGVTVEALLDALDIKNMERAVR